MKAAKLPAVAQLDCVLDICVDVSKAKLNVYYEIGDRGIDDEWANTTRQIEAKLCACQRLAEQHGLQGLRIVCEPSGGYQDKLMRTARRLGHLTAYVNAEAVAKFRVVETNDSGKDFLYTTSGRALVSKYNCNPYRIVRVGKSRFERAMRRQAPRIRQTTLDRLWDNAVTSARHQHTAEHAGLLELQVQQLWEEFVLHEQRKMALGERLVSLLQQLRQMDPAVPEPTPGVINAKNLARLIGETGPLSDFTSWRGLLRYAGLNIRMRQSGTYRGQYRITKKGRPLLRKILSQIVLPLVRRQCLYGEYYHRKRIAMPGQKAMVVVMRHFLRKLHGWYRSARAFDHDRYFASESQLQRQAA